MAILYIVLSPVILVHIPHWPLLAVRDLTRVLTM
jgi:hypothetical protein